jgi:hypothetical protein
VWVEFNTYEALFWFLVGGVANLLGKHRLQVSRAWLIGSVVNVLMLGVTDVVEVYTGGFLHTATWLLWWKAVHVFGLLVSVVWYLRCRQYVR